jgi:hypothetical protein
MIHLKGETRPQRTGEKNMSNAATRQELKAAARAATNAWTDDMDNDAKFAAYMAAQEALDAFEAEHGKEVVQLCEARVAEMMDRSVFGVEDRRRAAAKAAREAAVPAAARVTAADLAIERGITGRIRAGALAELENLVDPAVDMPLYHDAEFLRAEIRRVVDQVRADIATAKAEHLARAA